MDVRQFFVEGLGHSSYLLISDSANEAAIVDPRRDIEVYVGELERSHLKLRYVLETHTHNDYVSGAKPLAERFRAEYVASDESGLEFPFRPVREGDELRFGEIKISVLSTPGHTPEHVSYLVTDVSRADTPVSVFSGGDLLVGGVGRPDLLGQELARGLAPQLYHSLHDKFLRLDDYVEVLPTHGSGSLCGKGVGGKRTTTVGYERRFSPLLQQGKDEFVAAVLTGNGGIPTYYARMRPTNQAGPALWVPPAPRALAASQVLDGLSGGGLLVDARPANAFGAGHIPGSVNVALGPSFATWVGWLLPANVPLVLVLQSADQWPQAIPALASVGYDKVAGYVVANSDDWRQLSDPPSTVPQWRVDELRRRMDSSDVQVVDVRADSEFAEGHIAGALHIRLEDLSARVGELRGDRQTAVVCGSGARSSTATSLMLRFGVNRVANVRGGMTAWHKAGYPVASVEPSARRAA